MPGTSAPRPGQKWQGRRVEREDRLCIEPLRQFTDDLPAPVVHQIKRMFALPCKAPEHGWSRIPNQDHEPRVVRHLVLSTRRKPSERHETFPPDGLQDRVIHGSAPARIARFHHLTRQLDVMFGADGVVYTARDVIRVVS